MGLFLFYLYSAMKRFLICLLSLVLISAKAQQQKLSHADLQKSQYYWIYKGYTAVENGKYKEAIVNYTKAIRLDSSFSEAFRYRATAYCYLKSYNEALADFDCAIKLDPEDAASYNGRGAIYEELGIFKVAIKDYAKAVEILPHNRRYKENLENAQDKETARNNKK
jgi:tetratricopeptide (TPR) repeat protein